MTLKNLALATAVAALTLTAASCGGNQQDDKVRQFAEDLGRKAAANQLDSVRLLYPGASAADSLALAFNADNVTITPGGAEGQYTVAYSPTASVDLAVSPEGAITVTGSKGLFAYPAARLERATKYGQYVAGLPDADIAARMADSTFTDTVRDRFVSQFKSRVTVPATAAWQGDPEFMNDNVEGIVTVRNGNDAQIEGADYTLSYTLEDMRYGSSQESEAGKTIGAKGSASYTVYGSLYCSPYQFRIAWKLTPEQIFDKYYTPTGKEWDEAHAAAPAAPAK